jgi:thiaminase
MRVNKLQELKNQLKDVFYNNIQKFKPEQASKILDIIINGKLSKVKSTLLKINNTDVN